MLAENGQACFYCFGDDIKTEEKKAPSVWWFIAKAVLFAAGLAWFLVHQITKNLNNI
jgi:hypothetical protein